MKEITKTTQGERLKAVLSYYKLSQTALSQRLGIGKSYVSQIINDLSPITSKVLSGMIKSFPRLNSNWLLAGNGHMFLDDEPVKNYQIEGGAPRTLQDLEEDYRNDPLLALKEVLKDYEERITALEQKVIKLQEGSTKVVDKEKI